MENASDTVAFARHRRLEGLRAAEVARRRDDLLDEARRVADLLTEAFSLDAGEDLPSQALGAAAW